MKKEIEVESYYFDWEELELKKIEEKNNGSKRTTKTIRKNRQTKR